MLKKIFSIWSCWPQPCVFGTPSSLEAKILESNSSSFIKVLAQFSQILWIICLLFILSIKISVFHPAEQCTDCHGAAFFQQLTLFVHATKFALNNQSISWFNRWQNFSHIVPNLGNFNQNWWSCLFYSFIFSSCVAKLSGWVASSLDGLNALIALCFCRSHKSSDEYQIFSMEIFFSQH